MSAERVAAAIEELVRNVYEGEGTRVARAELVSALEEFKNSTPQVRASEVALGQQTPAKGGETPSPARVEPCQLGDSCPDARKYGDVHPAPSVKNAFVYPFAMSEAMMCWLTGHDQPDKQALIMEAYNAGLAKSVSKQAGMVMVPRELLSKLHEITPRDDGYYEVSWKILGVLTKLLKASGGKQ